MKYPKRSQYKHAKQKKYHVGNWAEYNEGLCRRGDLTVWFDEGAIANWKADKSGKPGGQWVYSEMAIERLYSCSSLLALTIGVGISSQHDGTRNKSQSCDSADPHLVKAIDWPSGDHTGPVS